MKKDQVIIFVLVGLMLFSAVATGLYFVVQDDTTTDSDAAAVQNDEQVCLNPSADIAGYQGNPAGEWPFTSTPTEALVITDLQEGTGAELVLGNCISVHYRLSLADGTPVEGNNTFETGQPVTFEFVEGGLIQGWTDGLPGMKEGGVRRLVVPPALGYGEAERTGIPPGSTLIFDVELVKIEY